MYRLTRVIIASMLLLAVGSVSSGQAVNARSLAQEAKCTITVDKTASPTQIKLGETVTISLKVDGSCPVKERPADVILAIDHSESMNSQGKLAAAQNAAITFINRMDPTLVRIGIVSVSRDALKIQDLTTDSVNFEDKIRPEGHGGGLESGLDLTGENFFYC